MEKIHLYKYQFYGKNFPILLFFLNGKGWKKMKVKPLAISYLA